RGRARHDRARLRRSDRRDPLGDRGRRLSGEETIAAAGRALGTPVERARRVAGGDINDAWQLRLADGTEAFLKSRPGARNGEYELEAAGLEWLGDVAGGLPVPSVLGVVGEDGTRGLVLEWVDEGRLDEAGEELLGS